MIRRCRNERRRSVWTYHAVSGDSVRVVLPVVLRIEEPYRAARSPGCHQRAAVQACRAGRDRVAQILPVRRQETVGRGPILSNIIVEEVAVAGAVRESDCDWLDLVHGGPVGTVRSNYRRVETVRKDMMSPVAA